ncbi:hypothetical protein [Riemerella anatipestifer]|nr:hypothetical protein [Riemerella anatipestifer]
MNLVELNSQELIQVEGGRIPIRPVVKFLKTVKHEIGDFFRGMADGFAD